MVYIILLIQSLIASGSYIIAKVIVRDIDPVAITFFRSLIAASGFIAISLIYRLKYKFDKKDFKFIFILSLITVTINQYLFFFGIKYTTPSNAALLYAATPTLVLLISYYKFGEKLTFRKGTGVAIAFLGIVVVIFERGIDFSSEYLFGNLIILIGVISWAIYTAYGRGLVLKYGAMQVSSITLILGAFLFLPFGIAGTANFDFNILKISHISGLLYLGFGTSITAYFLWYYALGKIEASKVAIFANLQPILTTIFAVLLLDQIITTNFIVGGIIAISGVILTQSG